MTASGYVVHEILAQAAVPANRPIDHLRRVGTAFSLGTAGGTLLAIAGLGSFRLAPVAVALAATLALGALGLAPWLIRRDDSAEAVPVVARVLGTNEPAEMRLVWRAKRTAGILVPVVCRPVGPEGALGADEGDFRAVVEIPAGNPDKPQEPEVGSLLALMQAERGMGVLVPMPDGQANAGQRELMARLAARPKSLKNAAPILPIRRGPLERVPGWAAAEFWTAAVVGAIVSATAFGAIAN